MNNDEYKFDNEWIKKNCQEDNFLELRYKVFLKYARSNAKHFMEEFEKGKYVGEIVLFTIWRPVILEWKKRIIKDFVEGVYHKLCAEVPSISQLDLIPDFTKTIEGKIVCFIAMNSEDEIYSRSLDLYYLMKLLRCKDISYQLKPSDNEFFLAISINNNLLMRR